MNEEFSNNPQKRQWKVPYGDKVLRVIKTFSLTEKIIFYFFVFLFAISGLVLLYQVNKLFLVEVPDYGGSLSEGVLGSPRFINPLLASSDIDRDLTALIYSGLLKVNSTGELVPDLAESYTISPDGLVYTFVLKNNIYFHDGVKMTADDVVFTILKAQDPNLKSPKEANWSGVRVDKVDDKTIAFTLKQAYSPFISNLTLGILPKHIWKDASVEEFPFSQFNTKPVGTGPYQINSITYGGSGLPSEYHLKSFGKYVLGKPFITEFTIKSYPNLKELTDAYKNGNIESLNSISPKQLPQLKVASDDILLSPLPRVFGIFFNQNVDPIFVNKEVRLALATAINKQEIVDNVLDGFGQIIDGPIPPDTIAQSNSEQTQADRIEKAKAILTKAGWKQNDDGIFQKPKDKKNFTTLSFSISTGDAPELKQAAYLLQKQWEAMGAQVDVKIFEIGDLNQNVIRPRKYDSLFFGEVVGRDNDLYQFWHSSERATPGLNIAMYTNVKADKALENIRKTSDLTQIQGYLGAFSKEISNDVPAVFTYSPYFIYIVPKRVKDVQLGELNSVSERFADVSKWYIETNSVWKIFYKPEQND